MTISDRIASFVVGTRIDRVPGEVVAKAKEQIVFLLVLFGDLLAVRCGRDEIREPRIVRDDNLFVLTDHHIELDRIRPEFNRFDEGRDRAEERSRRLLRGS